MQEIPVREIRYKEDAHRGKFHSVYGERHEPYNLLDPTAINISERFVRKCGNASFDEAVQAFEAEEGIELSGLDAEKARFGYWDETNRRRSNEEEEFSFDRKKKSDSPSLKISFKELFSENTK